MKMLKAGDQVVIECEGLLVSSGPEQGRVWSGVTATVKNDQTHADAYLHLHKLSIDYNGDSVCFQRKNLVVLNKKVSVKSIEKRLKEAKEAHKESMEQLALASSVDELVALRMDVEFNNGLIAAFEELLESR